MKLVLMALALIAGGAVLPFWAHQPEGSDDLDNLLTKREQVFDEIAALEDAEPLAPVDGNWHRLKRYVAMYQDLTLTVPTKQPIEPAVETDAWQGLLSGDLEQLLSAAFRIQTLTPVHFEYLSYADDGVARLNVSVLGQTD